VAIVRASTGGLCSGTIVAPTLVLTAAHCVSGVPAGDLQVVIGATTAAPDQTLAVTAAVPYPDYDSETDGIPGGVDLGFVTLASVATVTPLAVRTDTTDAELAAADVTIVGYGVDDGSSSTGAGTRRDVTLSVSQVCSRLIRAGGQDANACVGDSGGAVLMGGALVGVVSGGSDGCFSPTTFMRTDAHADWIAAVLGGGSAATCPATCTTPDSSCTAATETREAGVASVDAGPEAAGDAGADSSVATGAGGGSGGGCSAAGRGPASGVGGVDWVFLAALAWPLGRRRRA
jgi:trypsin